MKDNTKETGQKGEKLAANFLVGKGYQILEENWRYSRAEIDIIASKHDLLVFVEVKTRSSKAFGSPGEFLSTEQERRISDAAYAYCESIGHDWEIRFDLIEVLLNQTESSQITHYPDAFYPGDAE